MFLSTVWTVFGNNHFLFFLAVSNLIWLCPKIFLESLSLVSSKLLKFPGFFIFPLLIFYFPFFFDNQDWEVNIDNGLDRSRSRWTWFATFRSHNANSNRFKHIWLLYLNQVDSFLVKSLNLPTELFSTNDFWQIKVSSFRIVHHDLLFTSYSHFSTSGFKIT